MHSLNKMFLLGMGGCSLFVWELCNKWGDVVVKRGGVVVKLRGDGYKGGGGSRCQRAI